MNKNIIIVILFGSLIGYLFGNLLFKNYSGSNYINSDGNIYYLQYGVYTTKEAAELNTINLTREYIIKEIDNKYYIYLGITTSYDKALELKKLFEQDNIYIYIRSDYVENSETLEILKQYDLKINNDNVSSVMKEIFENEELNL